MSEGAPVRGTVATGFERVRDVFRRNFTQRGELGAAVAAYHDGEKVVDLWGGYRDAEGTSPWTEDTLVLVFSTTKGVAAAGMAHTHSQGLFEYDEAVSQHWPAFGRRGKDGITIRELLGHRAGVAAIGRNVRPDTVVRDSLPPWLVKIRFSKPLTPKYVPRSRN